MKKALILALTCLVTTYSFAEWDPHKLENWEKEAIAEIFITMAEKSMPSLIFETLNLTRLGDKIQHVPPLQFLAYIMTDPRLRDCIQIISHSYLKWPFFLDGVQNNMEKELTKGRLFSDLPHFARIVGRDHHQLKLFCEQQQWNEFVRFLL